MSKADLKDVAKIENLIVEAMQLLRAVKHLEFCQAPNYLKEALEEVKAVRFELEYERGPVHVVVNRFRRCVVEGESVESDVAVGDDPAAVALEKQFEYQKSMAQLRADLHEFCGMQTQHSELTRKITELGQSLRERLRSFTPGFMLVPGEYAWSEPILLEVRPVSASGDDVMFSVFVPEKL